MLLAVKLIYSHDELGEGHCYYIFSLSSQNQSLISIEDESVEFFDMNVEGIFEF
jgi:hypothetical protein